MNYCPLCVPLILQRNVISIHPQILRHCANKPQHRLLCPPLAHTNHNPPETMTLSLISLQRGVDNITGSSSSAKHTPPLLVNKMSFHFLSRCLFNRNIILSPGADLDEKVESYHSSYEHYISFTLYYYSFFFSLCSIIY